MRAARTRREALLFGLSFLYGAIVLFIIVAAPALSQRLIAFGFLTIGCLALIIRTRRFWQSWYIPAVVLINYIIIATIALNDDPWERIFFAMLIITISFASNHLKEAQRIKAAQRETERDIADEIDEEITTHRTSS